MNMIIGFVMLMVVALIATTYLHTQKSITPEQYKEVGQALNEHPRLQGMVNNMIEDGKITYNEYVDFKRRLKNIDSEYTMDEMMKNNE